MWWLGILLLAVLRVRRPRQKPIFVIWEYIPDENHIYEEYIPTTLTGYTINEEGEIIYE